VAVIAPGRDAMDVASTAAKLADVEVRVHG